MRKHLLAVHSNVSKALLSVSSLAQEGRRALSAAATPPSRMDTAEVTLDMSRKRGGPVWQARAAVLEDGTLWAVSSGLPGSLHTPCCVWAPWGWQTHWADLFYATMFVVGSPAWYLGHLPEVRHRLWDSAASQRVSCCRCLKPQPRPAPQRRAEKGNVAWAINQPWCCHPRWILCKNKIKTPSPKYPPKEVWGLCLW